MTTVEYSERDDGFYFVCHDCDAEGHMWTDERDADRHDDLHDEEPS